MILRNLLRISKAIHWLPRRSYYSSKITELFINNFEKYSTKLKNDESSHKMKQIGNLLNEFTQQTESIKEVEKELSNKAPSDPEMLELMKEEKVELEAKRVELIARVLNDIHSYELSQDTERIPDSSSVLFEISAGVGGKEAMLFANELCIIYINYFNYKRWNIADVESDEQGGYLRHYQAKVEGRNVWDCMKYEAGVHRVQRVPETEARGRVHTSTVSIACIPFTEDSVVELNASDLRIQTKTASGAGGQHVNKTESAIRITHMPSGTTVECQEDRSQIKNREIAMRRLRKILTDRQINETFEKHSKTRKSQVGQANRNEKIRTYNFNQDRVTDHRLSSLNIAANEKEDTLYDLEGFFASPDRLDGFIKNLQKVEKEHELLEIFKRFDNKAQ